ncbi:MAG: MFS transporter [Promethearchaeota archaeon]
MTEEKPVSRVPDGVREDKLRVGRTFLIGLGFFTTGVAWAFYNFIIPIILNERLPSFFGKEIVIGFIMVIDNLFAVALQPYFGALSDRMQSKYGRRTPFILIGCTSAAILFIIVPLMPGIGLFIAVILAYNMMMAFYRAPVVTLMPDLTPERVRSSGNAVINLMGGLGFVLAYLIRFAVSPLEASLGLDGGRFVAFLIVAIVMLAAEALLFLTVKEVPTGDSFFKVGPDIIRIDPLTGERFDVPAEQLEREKHESKWKDLKDVFVEEDKSALFMLLAIAALAFGYNAVETWASLWATEYLGLSEGNASLLILILPAVFIAFAFPAGILAEKFGRRLMIKIGFAGVLAACIILFLVRDFTVILVVFVMFGIFYALINVNTIVVVWQLAPKGKTGGYTGIYYLFQQIAAIVSPVVVGAVFTLIVAVSKQDTPAKYLGMFPFMIACMALGLVFMFFVKRGEAELTKEELEALKVQYEEVD